MQPRHVQVQSGDCALLTLVTSLITLIDTSSSRQQLCPSNMDPKTLASEIIKAGADKVLEKDPKRVDDALVNTVIKQGANALESGASKGGVDAAVGAAAEVQTITTLALGHVTGARHNCVATCSFHDMCSVFERCMSTAAKLTAVAADLPRRYVATALHATAADQCFELLLATDLTLVLLLV